jgi:ribosomal protein RSM22 (predicted rRNA methylase)
VAVPVQTPNSRIKHADWCNFRRHIRTVFQLFEALYKAVSVSQYGV